jgi:SepF-like predicted cell division protein (DUF552 family)
MDIFNKLFKQNNKKSIDSELTKQDLLKELNEVEKILFSASFYLVKEPIIDL